MCIWMICNASWLWFFENCIICSLQLLWIVSKRILSRTRHETSRVLVQTDGNAADVRPRAGERPEPQGRGRRDEPVRGDRVAARRRRCPGCGRNCNGEPEQPQRAAAHARHDLDPGAAQRREERELAERDAAGDLPEERHEAAPGRCAASRRLQPPRPLFHVQPASEEDG